MATLILSAAGSAIGGAVGGSFLGLTAAAVGQAVGATLGSVIDARLMGQGSEPVTAAGVDTLRIQGAAEGASVSRVYGRMRVPGQVIWATRFKERRVESGGGSGKNASPKLIEFSYSVSVAVALCEGEVQRIGRVWADGNPLSLDGIRWRLHRGTEDQLPDDLISAVEGDAAAAYRGIAYLVFEDLDLAQFGNRVPQFNFEVIRRPNASLPIAPIDPYQAIRSVALVPGTGEYALATTPVVYDYGTLNSGFANVNNSEGTTDLEVSLDHLFAEIPNTESVAMVVSWFGDDLRVSRCKIKPKVEQTSFDGSPLPWTVAGLSRSNAETVSKISDRPAFGGTPSDQSIIQAIREIHSRGGSVMYYPFILMDIPEDNTLQDPYSGLGSQGSYPWRGRITLDVAPGQDGTTDQTATAAEDVAGFFGSARADDFEVSGDTITYTGPAEWSFRRFILHSAAVCKAAGGVNAFCIGTEMRGLTQIRSSRSDFPAVDEFIGLASDVRAILGPNTKITYAADWSEYSGYRPSDGSGDLFFHLDQLWSSPNIDFIGIDNYMPLSDWRDHDGHSDSDVGSIYNLDYLSSNVAGGEGYDWYYADVEARDRQERSEISDTAYGEHWVFRYKDLKRWWSSPHYNRPNGVRELQPTAWEPRSKPIWFTELGCAAIDKGANQPNVFLDVKSSESAVPYYSTSGRDDFIQWRFLQAHFMHWADPVNNPTSPVYGGPMVDMDRAHIWAWDSRPWPDFPDRLTVWSDGENYARGHWLTGRTSLASVAGIVADVVERAGVENVDLSGVSGAVSGYLASNPESPRQTLQPLMLAKGFDAFDVSGEIVFRDRTAPTIIDLPEVALVEGVDGSEISFARVPEAEAPEQVQVNFYETDRDYQRGASSAGLPSRGKPNAAQSDLPISMTSAEGTRIAERWLLEGQVARDTVTLSLPMSFLHLSPGDAIRVTGEGGGIYRVDRIEDTFTRKITATRIEDGVYSPGPVADGVTIKPNLSLPGPVFVRFLDLPLLDADDQAFGPHIAAASLPWTGRVAIYGATGTAGFQRDGDILSPSTLGKTETHLGTATHGLWSNAPDFYVRLDSGALESRSREDVLSGANLAALRAPDSDVWEIFQFAEAVLLDDRLYRLDWLLRGQAGTASVHPASYPPGSEFVLLDGSAVQPDLADGLEATQRTFRVGPASRDYLHVTYQAFTRDLPAVGRRPYAPAHIHARRRLDGDVAITWIRQTRVGGDNWNGIDVPLSEESESYLVELLDNEDVRRSWTVSAPLVIYSVQDQVADGLTADFDIRISQVSGSYGPGPYKRIRYNG